MRLCSLLLLLLVAAPAFAQTGYTWRGGDGSWFSDVNWSPSGIPGVVDTAYVESGRPDLVRDTTVARLVLDADALDGDGNLTVTDSLVWRSGEMNGRNFAETAAVTIAPGALMLITGPDEKGLRSRDILNEGTIRWEEGGLVVQFTTTLDNRPGATFDLRGDDAITRTNGTLDLLNRGLLVKSRGTGTTALSYPFGVFENEGTVRVETGTLLLANGTSFTARGDGVFEIASGARLTVRQARYRFGEGSSLAGAGTLRVESGELDLGRAAFTGLTQVAGGTFRLVDTAMPSDLAAVELSGGELGGLAETNVNGPLAWTGGVLGTRTGGSGVLHLLGGAAATGPDAKQFRGGTFTNASLFRWAEGPLEVASSAALTNLAGATFAIESDTTWTRVNGFITVVNEGLIVKRGSPGQTSITLPFAPFNNDGEVRVETGTLFLNIANRSTDAGAYVVEDGATLRLDGAERTFTPDASITGAGTLRLTAGNDGYAFSGTFRPGDGVGVMAVDSDWPAFEPDGVFEMEIAGFTPGTEHDLLAVAGAATLGGTLRVVLTEGFALTEGDRFTILTAASVTGTYDALDLPAGVGAFVEKTDTTAVLVVGQVVANEDGAAEALPTAFALDAPYPNPVATTATLAYAVPEATAVRVVLYDLLGRQVAVLADGTHAAGRYDAALDAARLPSGVYVVRMEAEGFQQTHRLARVR
ncbi:MAG: T9SS type A sorting domain-containing protein [Bacteroidota bacterium]